MSSYGPQSWQVPIREASWEQGPASAGLNASPSIQPQVQQQGEQTPFHRQFEEIERAYDNLAKSGKLYSMAPRRDSMPMMSMPPQPFADFGPRMPQRHSIDYDAMRTPSGSNAQNFYASQRHPPRQNDNEQMMQAKRRMAAQRERELRNYHQEQQYSKGSNPQGSSDGAVSPSGMNEDDRRELIARQHRALYGNDAPFYDQESNTPRPSNPTSGHASSAGGRGPSPRSYDPFNMGQGQPQGAPEDAGQLNANEQNQQGGKGPSPKPQTGSSHENSTASPASNPPNQNFSLFESTTQQSSRTSTSSPGGGSPPRQGKTSAPGVAPIGTRPGQASNPALANKRSGTPSQSPLSHGFSTNNDNLKPRGPANERSTSSASNPSSGAPKEPTTSTWGSSSGVWGTSGNNKSVGAVWG